MNFTKYVLIISAIAALSAAGCKGETGSAGTTGPTGNQGSQGTRLSTAIPLPPTGNLVVFSSGGAFGGGASQVYSVNIATREVTNLATLPYCDFRPAFDPSTKALWGVTGRSCGESMYALNTASSTGTLFTHLTLRDSYGGMTFSPDGTTILASAYNCCPSNSIMIAVDKTTGVQTSLGNFRNGATAVHIQGLAFSPSGTLYGIDGRNNAQLYTIDLPLAGVGGTTPVSPVGTPGVCTSVAGYMRSIVFYNGTIYGITPASWDNPNLRYPSGRVYSFDLSTGACTLVAETGIGGRYNGLAVVP